MSTSADSVPRLSGSGGFINISQSAKKLIFVGTFVVPSHSRVHDGGLVIADAVVTPQIPRRCRAAHVQRQYAAAAGQSVLYVTERCVFRLTRGGLELIEIAPGVDLEKDILAHIGFEPIIDGEPRPMDPRIFAAEPMGLKATCWPCRWRPGSPTTPNGTCSSSPWQACR